MAPDDTVVGAADGTAVGASVVMAVGARPSTRLSMLPAEHAGGLQLAVVSDESIERRACAAQNNRRKPGAARQMTMRLRAPFRRLGAAATHAPPSMAMRATGGAAQDDPSRTSGRACTWDT